MNPAAIHAAGFLFNNRTILKESLFSNLQKQLSNIY